MNVNCPNCGGLLQLGDKRWQCAWCERRGTYVQGPLLANGRRWRVLVTDQEGDQAHHRRWIPAHSMPYAQRVAPQERAR